VNGTRRLAWCVILLGVLSMAPTVGDVGGCGREARELDRDIFAAARKDEDCTRCTECGIESARCGRACDPGAAPDVALPVTCRPLVRDGEVCLRALRAASCDVFASYVDDMAPASPSECGFCRVGPGEPAGAFADAGAP
jgi:hypothetical protein